MARSSVHPLTIAAGIFLCGAFVVVNTYARVRWWSINFDMPDGLYEHGWPVSYMTRDLIPPEADMGGIIYEPWPLVNQYGPATLLEFRPVWLGVDIVVAILLIVSSVSAIEPIARRWKSPLQFSIRHLLAVSALICVCLTVGRYSRLSLFDVVFYPVHIVPNYLIIASIVLSVWFFVSRVRAVARCTK